MDTPATRNPLPASDPMHPWWGEYRLSDGLGLRCRVGTLRLTAVCRGEEWLLSWDIRRELADDGCTLAEEEAVPGYPNAERHLFTRPRERLYLAPRLADRPVVSRAAVPFHLAAGEEAIVFVSSPLWVAIEVGDPRAPLADLPLQRPSDTWFGANTQEGELCYASQTAARRSAGELPARPYRAITPVRIHNAADTPLRLDRISLPAPYLSLYSDARGMLWTQAITLRREEGNDLAALAMETKPPQEAQGAVPLAGPRRSAGKNALVRAFGALFG